MKKIMILFAAISVSIVAVAQQDQTNPQTQPSTTPSGNTSLDGKVFAVTLTDNSVTSVNGTAGNMSSEKAMDNPNVAQPKRTDQGTDIDSKTGKKMIVRFENGVVKTSGKGIMKVEKCGYNSVGIASTGISFTADCESSNTSMKSKSSSSSTNSSTQTGTSGYDKPPAGTGSNTNTSTTTTTTTVNSSPADKNKISLTGTVNDDSIHGIMTCTKADGSVKNYSYVGKTADRNDLDMEGETGMK